MATTARRARFQCDRKDISVNQAEINIQREINDALLSSIDANSLRSGLKAEITNHSTLNITWKRAENLFREKNKEHLTLRTKHPNEYHIALIAYTLETGFYAQLNKACREIKSPSDAERFMYRHYWKILTLAIVEVPGYPRTLGYDELLYRGCPFVFPGLRTGDLFTLKHFVSTSVDEKIAYEFGPDIAGTKPSSILVMENIMKSGCDANTMMGANEVAAINIIRMNHHSEYPDENEVLIWSMEVFEVKDLVQQGPVTKVYLKAQSPQ